MNEALVASEVWIDGGLDSSRLVDKVLHQYKPIWVVDRERKLLVS
jgi:hypothetical protein